MGVCGEVGVSVGRWVWVWIGGVSVGRWVWVWRGCVSMGVGS